MFKFESNYQIGEAVFFDVLNDIHEVIHQIPAYVRAVIFSNSKVRYSLFLKQSRSTIHNVDSVFVSDRDPDEIMEFGPDNYS